MIVLLEPLCYLIRSIGQTVVFTYGIHVTVKETGAQVGSNGHWAFRNLRRSC